MHQIVVHIRLDEAEPDKSTVFVRRLTIDSAGKHTATHALNQQGQWQRIKMDRSKHPDDCYLDFYVEDITDV